jgi:transposase
MAWLRIKLKDSEIKELEGIRRKTEDSRNIRAYMVLLNAQGLRVPEIAEKLGKNGHTIRDWVKRYRSNGIAGLTRKLSPGRPREQRNKAILLLETLISKSPRTYGYIYDTWDKRLIMEEYEKQTGKKLSSSTAERALREAGYSYKRPKKGVPPNAPRKEEKIKKVNEIIADIQRKAIQEDVDVYFLDESHFSTEAYLLRGWFKKGEHFFPKAIIKERAVRCLEP